MTILADFTYNSTLGGCVHMTLVVHIVVTALLSVFALTLIITACLLDIRHLAWCGFGLGIIAQGSYFDCRLRWITAAQRYDYDGGDNDLRLVR